MATTPSPSVVRRDIETALIEKCWKDPQFQKAIVSDPRSVIEAHTGQKLPENLKIFIHEEDASTLHFSIPPAPANVTELSDNDLEKVAGGTEVGMVVAGIFLATATIAAAGVTALNKDKIGW